MNKTSEIQVTCMLSLNQTFLTQDLVTNRSGVFN